jgi:hypothetical protein
MPVHADETDGASSVRRLLAAAVVLGLVLSACTPDDPPGSSGPTGGSDSAVTGTVLVAQGFGGGLATIELPDGDPQPLTMPEDVRFMHAAYVDEDGEILAVVEDERGRVRAYRLGAAAAAVPISPPLQVAHSFSFAAGHLLAARCDRRASAWVLDVAVPEQWRPAPGACGATLSPDGTAVAWSPDGRRVVWADTDAEGRPEPVLGPADLDDLPPGMQGLEVIGALSWGPEGLAIPLGNNERQAAAVFEPDGTVGITPLGARGAGIGASLSWQPSGELLAVASWGTLEAIVRVFPPRGQISVLAIDSYPMLCIVCS